MPIFSRQEIEALLARYLELSGRESKRFRQRDTSNAVFGCTAGRAPSSHCLNGEMGIGSFAISSATFDARDDRSRLEPIGVARPRHVDAKVALPRKRIFSR
jgi:hypothetical protein